MSIRKEEKKKRLRTYEVHTKRVKNPPSTSIKKIIRNNIKKRNEAKLNKKLCHITPTQII